MTKPQRWPENANAARNAAIDAAEDTLDGLIDLTMARADEDRELVKRTIKRLMRLQNYVVKVLTDAKHGLPLERYPEEIESEGENKKPLR